MERLSITPRENWQAKVESLGLTFHTIDNKPYWNEHACYHFKENEIELLRESTREIESLCMELVEHVVSQEEYYKLNIPEYAWPLIEASWRNKEKPLTGRLDLSYNGKEPPKLLEYNADTPACLLESSLVQKQWVQEAQPNKAQFNSLHEKLVQAWPKMASERIHLTWRLNLPWTLSDITYVATVAREAGLDTKTIFIEDIRWDGRRYIDQDNETINYLFKRFPWEITREDVFNNISTSHLQMIEPAWKMILNNKGFLVLLWELFPNHPNLLPAYFSPDQFEGDYAKKPFVGREGDNISLFSANGVFSTEGYYDNGKFMYQKAHYLPNFDGNYAVIGSWLIAGEPAGIIIREEDTPVTRSSSRFVPHYYG